MTVATARRELSGLKTILESPRVLGLDNVASSRPVFGSISPISDSACGRASSLPSGENCMPPDREEFGIVRPVFQEPTSRKRNSFPEPVSSHLPSGLKQIPASSVVRRLANLPPRI